MPSFGKCSHCKGYGIQFDDQPDRTPRFRWCICRPCSGRGEHPYLSEWKIPDSAWITCTTTTELVAISIEVRLRAPTAPHLDMPKESLIILRKERMDDLRRIKKNFLTKYIKEKVRGKVH